MGRLATDALGEHGADAMAGRPLVDPQVHCSVAETGRRARGQRRRRAEVDDDASRARGCRERRRE